MTSTANAAPAAATTETRPSRKRTKITPESPEAISADALPFVQPPNAGQRRRYWRPCGTDNATFDLQLGEVWADAALVWMRQNPEKGPYLLSSIVYDLAKSPDIDADCAVIHGLMIRFGRAMMGAAYAGNVVPLRSVA